MAMLLQLLQLLLVLLALQPGNHNLVAYGVVGGTGVPSNATVNKLARWDPDLSGSTIAVVELTGSSQFGQFNVKDFVAVATTGSLGNGRLVRRLTSLSSGSTSGARANNSNWKIALIYEVTTGGSLWGAKSWSCSRTNCRKQFWLRIAD